MAYESAGRHNGFKVQIQEIFWRRSTGSRPIRIAANSTIYTSGQRDATVYLIESGKVKLVLPTPEGSSCLLAMRTTGDIFGELCLVGDALRLETAIAVQNAVLRQISRNSFLADLRQKPALRPVVLHLASCVNEQQQIAATLTSETEEQRVAEFLLRLGWNRGGDDSCFIGGEQRLSQAELAEMVGTTGNRIRAFLRKFRELGLIGMNKSGRLVVREDSLSEYIARATFGERQEPNRAWPRTAGVAVQPDAPFMPARAPAAAACSL